jgi:uncharacterized protein YjbI with pentapeptide repeats
MMRRRRRGLREHVQHRALVRRSCFEGPRGHYGRGAFYLCAARVWLSFLGSRGQGKSPGREWGCSGGEKASVVVTVPVDRWRTPEGLRLRPGVLESLARSGAGLGDLVGVTPAGLADLRGFWGRDGYRLEGVLLDRIDFSRADLTGWQFLDVTVHGCDFTGADLRDSRWFGTAVESSTFDRARLEGAAVCTRSEEYPRQENSWVGCSFNRAKLKLTTFIGGLVQDCTFDDVRLSDVTFDGTQFVRTRFSGKLKEAIFDAPRRGDRYLDADGLDLSGAELDDGLILRYRSTGIVLPSNARFAILEKPAKQIPKALKKLRRRDDLASGQIRAILEGALHSAYRPDQHEFINLDDLGEFGIDEQFADLLASVRARFLGPPTQPR